MSQFFNGKHPFLQSLRSTAVPASALAAVSHSGNIGALRGNQLELVADGKEQCTCMERFGSAGA